MTYDIKAIIFDAVKKSEAEVAKELTDMFRLHFEGAEVSFYTKIGKDLKHITGTLRDLWVNTKDYSMVCEMYDFKKYRVHPAQGIEVIS